MAATTMSALAIEIAALASGVPSRLGDAMTVLAAEIERDAKVAAPVDTGFLRNSISTTVDRSALAIHAAASAEYAGFVEYGTSRMPPRPYVQPAVDRAAVKLDTVLTRLATLT